MERPILTEEGGTILTNQCSSEDGLIVRVNDIMLSTYSWLRKCGGHGLSWPPCLVTALTCNKAHRSNEGEDEPEKEDAPLRLPAGWGEAGLEDPVRDEQLQPLVHHAKAKHHEGSDEVDNQHLVILESTAKPHYSGRPKRGSFWGARTWCPDFSGEIIHVSIALGQNKVSWLDKMS